MQCKIKMAVPKNQPNPNTGKVVEKLWDKLRWIIDNDIRIPIYDSYDYMRTQNFPNIGDIVDCDGEYYDVLLTRTGMKYLSKDIDENGYVKNHVVCLSIWYDHTNNACLGIRGSFLKYKSEEEESSNG